MNPQDLLDPIIDVSRQAGAAILEIYQREDHQVERKADASPLTAADLAAHHLIIDALAALTPDLPVLSEEAAGIPWEERQRWSRYWLVDPLDGTREFIKRNGEFTVNIALIDQGVPVLGVVYVPVLDLLYCGVHEVGAWKEENGKRSAIRTQRLRPSQRSLRVVASRNHRGDALDAWLARLRQRFPDIELLNMGSSLKLCLVAEGKADIYPRLAPTSEWDTAAAQAILEAAGGKLVDVRNLEYRYNRKQDILNPFFFALGDESLRSLATSPA